MTKSQNTKNEQQKDLCITSEQLTEQWKKGKLTGEYWCEITESPYPERVYLPTCDSDMIVKVLAPVPSYEEWQAKLEQNAQLKKQINHLLKTQARQFVDNQKLQVKAEKAKDVVNIDTARQIKQLKELLEECSPYIGHSAASRMIKNSVGHKKDMKLLTKIDEVLNANKA